MSNLSKRILSAIILAPAFLYIIITGGIPFMVLCTAMFFIMCAEWVSMSSNPKFSKLQKITFWLLGTAYIGFATTVMVFLRLSKNKIDEYFGAAYMMRGLEYTPGIWTNILFLIIIIVWITDISAYFAGRAIGGPKLAPKISPNKTWSGAFGAIIGVSITYILCNYFTVSEIVYNAQYYQIWGVVVVLCVVSQIGDLLESYTKRRFEVKDSGGLLPGHGGLLDRFDGLLLVLNFVGVFIVGAFIMQKFF